MTKPTDGCRPPESLKDRLATIIQRAHVERRTSDEVAEMVLLEVRNAPEFDAARSKVMEAHAPLLGRLANG